MKEAILHEKHKEIDFFWFQEVFFNAIEIKNPQFMPYIL